MYLASILAHWKISGLKSRQVDSVDQPPIRCDPQNMQHQDFNINFQLPKEATSGFVIITKCRFKLSLTVSTIQIYCIEAS